MAAIGLVVFVVGVVRQATQWIGGPSLYGTPWVAVGVAVLGGSILGLGASRWYDTRPGGPANLRPPSRALGGSTIRDSPSFEIYRPEALDERRRRR